MFLTRTACLTRSGFARMKRRSSMDGLRERRKGNGGRAAQLERRLERERDEAEEQFVAAGSALSLKICPTMLIVSSKYVRAPPLVNLVPVARRSEPRRHLKAETPGVAGSSAGKAVYDERRGLEREGCVQPIGDVVARPGRE